MIRLDVLSSRLQEISSSGIFTEAGLDLFHNKTTVPSRIHPARGRPEGAGESRQSDIEVRPIQEAMRGSERHRPMSALSSARPSRHAVGYLIAIGSSVSGTWFAR
jgi:hypothetical protein